MARGRPAGRRCRKAGRYERLYSVRCGISRKDDTLPGRILTSPRREGGAGDNLPHMGLMLEEYYRYRGWDELGRPAPGKLAELGLGGG